MNNENQPQRFVNLELNDKSGPQAGILVLFDDRYFVGTFVSCKDGEAICKLDHEPNVRLHVPLDRIFVEHPDLV